MKEKRHFLIMMALALLLLIGIPAGAGADYTTEPIIVTRRTEQEMIEFGLDYMYAEISFTVSEDGKTAVGYVRELDAKKQPLRTYIAQTAEIVSFTAPTCTDKGFVKIYYETNDVMGVEEYDIPAGHDLGSGQPDPEDDTKHIGTCKREGCGETVREDHNWTFTGFTWNGSPADNFSGSTANYRCPVCEGNTSKACDNVISESLGNDAGNKYSLKISSSGSLDQTEHVSDARTFYYITFLDEDGALVLNNVLVEEGQTPAYPGDPPAKEPDETYHWTFKEWTPEITAVAGEAAYQAVYEGEEHSFTPQIVDESTHILKCECGAVKGEAHNFVNLCKDTDPDKHHMVCSECDYSLSEIPEDHTGGKATCVARAVCEVCNQPYGEIDPNAHDLVQHEAQLPTCTDIGWDAYEECIRDGCTYTTYAEKPAAEHQWKAWKQEDGKTHQRTCSNCDAAETGEHVWGDWLSVDPYDHQHNCTVCGEAYETEPHTWVNGVCSVCKRECQHDATEIRDAVESTCAKEGYTGDTWCLTCGMKVKDGEKTGRKPHTEVIDAAVEPTCTESGLTEGKHCSVCGEVLAAQETVQAKGHDLKKAESTAPTCTEPGTEACWICRRENCGKLFSDDQGRNEIEKPAVIPALNHDWDEGVITTPATCAAAGEKTYTCRNDSTHTKTEEIPADKDAHPEDRIVTDAAVEPTCTESGLTEGKHCSACNAVLEAQTVVPAKGHTPGKAVTEHFVGPQPGIPGRYDSVIYCSVCGSKLDSNPAFIKALPDDSVEITDGITWLKVEHEGTATWYGIDNSSGRFAGGSRFWVRLLSPADDYEEWKKYYDKLDEAHKSQAEDNGQRIFLFGVTDPTGTEYTGPFDPPVDLYVQLGTEWYQDDISAFFFYDGMDEPPVVQIVRDYVLPDGTAAVVAKITLRHF